MTYVSASGAVHSNPSLRVVAIHGAQQGTGVLLDPRHVLTCAHVIRDYLDSEEDPHRGPALSHPARADRVRCEVLWHGRDEGLDVALLRATEDVLPADHLPRLRTATLTGDDPLPGAQTLGFPGHQRYGGNKLDFGQYPGTVLPVAGRVRGALTFWLDHSPGSPGPGGASPLAGLSGAPVFAGPVLLGIVSRVRGEQAQQLEATPISVALRALLGYAALPGLKLEPMTAYDPADTVFEGRYAQAIKAQYGKTEIFGIDELGVSESSWDLDTAYLSLEATALRDVDAGRDQPLGDAPYQPYQPRDPHPRRVEELLGRSERTLLRGEAGAGKTTLVWWLAAHAACDTLPPELDRLGGLVPLVVPLRSVRAAGQGFPTPDRLAHAAGLPVGPAPDGWAERVLGSGRALLLVDGLDELPQSERSRARSWLTGLLARFPGTHCLATVRPGAVETAWLTGEGFTDLLLLPMSDTDIAVFVGAWHRAARKGHTTVECERLDGLEQRLLREFDGNRVLRDLARTPLLCAVICALHRKRHGRLPHTRWELYRATLDMLLGKRDHERGIDAPEGLTIGVEEHKLLLQHIAVWLVRCGQTQFTADDAVRQIERAIAYMPQVRAQGSAHQILAHLVNRSGLLQQRTGDTIQFIHRTFQDYLAAKELAENDSIGELVNRAEDEQWRDVILLSVGHLDRRVSRLIDGLVERANALPDPQNRPLRILAGHCASHAVFLAPDTRARAEDAVRRVMPPRDDGESHALAELGEWVLPLLPGPSGEARPDVRVISVHARVGDEAAVPRLREFTATDDIIVRDALARAWSSFPTEAYIEEVLSRIPLDKITVPAPTRWHLGRLHRLGRLRGVALTGNHPPDVLSAALPRSGLSSLSITSNPSLTDLGFVTERPSVVYLVLSDCPSLRSLDELADHSLDWLSLDLSMLSIPGKPPQPLQLRIAGESEVPYEALARWTSPENLTVFARAHLSALIEATRNMPALTELSLAPAVEIDTTASAPGITELTLLATTDPVNTAAVATALPALTELTLHVGEVPSYEIDLTPFHRRPDLHLTICTEPGTELHVTGREALADRLYLTHYGR
ncbi:NACHT domain-containing protein [Streptomyces sp. NPDC048057]|uniref:NACHT domain-containing protein n=1 Tax=Streptomyces sp. NPDC048057 TaxID=3155628 RepID=UPI0033FAC697